MADINERLDRLQRREEFDRFGRPLRHAQTPMRVAPLVDRPAGVDDRLGEVLDAVAAVVCRHPGMSVMVALADGQAGRPVIRVSEQDGGVDTGVVVVGTIPPRPVEPTTRPEPVAREVTGTEYGPYDGQSTPAAAPARESVPGSDPVFEPALRDGSPARDTRREEPTAGDPRDGLLSGGDAAPSAVHSAHDLFRDDQPGRDGPSYGDVPSRDGEPGREGRSAGGGVPFGEGVQSRDLGEGVQSRDLGEGVQSRDLGDGAQSRAFGEGMPSREAVGSDRDNARPAAFDGRHAADRERQAGAGRSGASWHDALWSPESRDRFRQAEQERRAREERPPAPGSSIPLPEDTSQVVSRLAQLLRENPTLAATWSREAQE